MCKGLTPLMMRLLQIKTRRNNPAYLIYWQHFQKLAKVKHIGNFAKEKIN
jgi:hypothetical protein